MEKGFYHPARGYWQTTNEPPQNILDGYPEGTVEVPLKPGAGKEWDGSAWVDDPDYAEPSNVPSEITKVQFVRAMRQMNLWETHKDTIEAHQDWPYITAIPRNDSMTLQMAQVIGATEQEMNDLWTLGATL